MLLIKFFNYFLIKVRNIVSKKLLLIFAQILIFKSRNFYKVIDLLEKAEVKIYSQNGEDGIIDYNNTSLNLALKNSKKVLPIFNHGSENGEYQHTKGPYGGVKVPFQSPNELVYENLKLANLKI